MKTIACIVGARPQFIKHAPLEIALKKYFNVVTIHTGQHYDENMSKIFFDELKMQKPDYIFENGGGSHGVQTAKMLIGLEKLLLEHAYSAIVVYGDTNTTLAAALAGAKLNIPIVHIEAGLRSFNRTMSEEINRIVTDHLSSILFAPTENAVNQLRLENIKNDVYLTGDLMCDMLLIAKELVSKQARAYSFPYYLATLHRPYNIDESERLVTILNEFNKLDKKMVFPIHPRTKNKMRSLGLSYQDFSNIIFTEPVGYFELINLQYHSSAVITDSGGIQKEAYILQRKCITVRPETEWVETLQGGWNTLVFDSLGDISGVLQSVSENYKENLYGDGKAAEEIAEILNSRLN